MYFFSFDQNRGYLAVLLSIILSTVTAQDAPDDSVVRANALAAQGDRAGAITLLEQRLSANPDDQLARQTLLGLRIGEMENEVRRLLAEQAKDRPGQLGDPDYESARKRSSEVVRRRLDVAEYYVRQHRYADAVATINAILIDHPNDPAVMTLKLQVLNSLANEERNSLLKEKASARENAINDVIDSAIMPGEAPRTKRQIMIFDEDVDAAERAELVKRLQTRIDIIYDGITTYKKADGTEEVAKPASVRQLLQSLFAIAGINYVLLDSALGEETLTLHLVQETVENCLKTVSKLVKVRFNYSGGTVFVANVDTDVLVTEIIRLKSGLTNVGEDLELGDFGGGGGSSSGSSGGSDSYNSKSNNSSTTTAAGGGKGIGKDSKGGGGKGGSGEANSDLELLLEKAPELIVGWPKDAKLFIDRKSNTVYVYSTPDSITELKRLINSIDYTSVQILIETRFVEVSDKASTAFGIDWEVSPNQKVIGGASITEAGKDGVGGFLGQVLATNGGSYGVSAKIKALESKNLADTLSEPKILTLNNSRGLIELKKEITYIGSYENIGSNTNYNNNQNNNGILVPQPIQTTTQVPKYEKDYSGIRLEIRPSVGRNSDIITLAVFPTVRVLVDGPQSTTFNSSDGSSTPITNTIQSPPTFDTRSLSTTLHVKNGGTVVLGGMASELQNRSSSGVPVLSRVPFIGALFGSKSTHDERGNLLIFITAHIIDPTGAKQGEEIEKLRDTARIILPDEVAEAEKNTEVKQAETERQGAEKAKSQERTEIWRRDRRH